MKPNRLWAYANIVAVIATIALNGLANALPLNGQTTGAISDRFQVYFVPAGYVFSIWGLIYLALIAFAIYQALPAQGENARLRRVGSLFVVSCLANVAWLFLWHYEQFALTVAAMLVLLASLIAIYLRLEIGRGRVPWAERALARFPFSLYLGWITVATIANVTSWLDYMQWSGWGIGPQAWTVIMLLAACGIAALMSLLRRDIVYLLVLIWAFVGIARKHAATPVVAVAAWVAVVLVTAVTVVGVLRKPRDGIIKLESN